MIMVMSYIFAVMFTAILACIMYPIAATFYLFGKVGYFVGWISKGAFTVTNSIIKYLWSDLAGTKKNNNIIPDSNLNNPVILPNNQPQVQTQEENNNTNSAPH